ncbi:MAG TPA: hypothetical protein VN040_20020, partial [Pseudosphingobacterium sp.]|nr:hypothetical protein [Pseudosphingobacterium sp.]
LMPRFYSGKGYLIWLVKRSQKNSHATMRIITMANKIQKRNFPEPLSLFSPNAWGEGPGFSLLAE